jgi:acyl carrier protein
MNAMSKQLLSIDTLSSEQLFDWVAQLLAEMFELDRASISLQSNLYLDLDIDSIDAVDLAVKLTQLTGKRLAPEKFRAIRTIADIVAALHGPGMIAERAA